VESKPRGGRKIQEHFIQVYFLIMRELQSLDDVYNKRLFRIPDYQRGYAWGTKQLTDFWEDLVCLDGNRFHYTGVLSIKTVPEEIWGKWNDEAWLIKKRKYTPYFIVDGQQRLTTTSIFLQCLSESIKALPENVGVNDEDVYLGSYNLKQIKERFIVVSQPPLNAINTYIFGYEADNPSFEFLRYKIYNEPFGGLINETFYTLNLENAKKFFQDNIKAIAEEQGKGILEELYEKITQRFMFNLYEINDDFDVFVAFETMNNRGKSLSDLELLKNRLIYLTTLYRENEVKENDKIAIRKNINDAWREIYFQLGRNKHHPLNDDDFLKAHWTMYFKYSRKKGDDYIRFLLDEEFSPKKVLQKVEVKTDSLAKIVEFKEIDQDDDDDAVEQVLATPTPQMKAGLPIVEINNYVLSLKAAAKHWYNSYNPENNSDLTNDESLLIDRLNRIGIGYFRPLVMSLFTNQKITENDRKLLLAEIERFIFLTFRLSRAMSNFRSSVYYNAARELYYSERSVSSIVQALRQDLASTQNKDGSFKHSYFRDHIDRKFSAGGTGFYGWNGLRYFLFEYEEELMKMRNQPKIAWKNFVRSEKDKLSIEHIYPQTDSSECWQNAFPAYNAEQKAFLQGSLGNLLPLSSSINSSLQNDCFEDKKNTKMDDKGNVIRNGYSNGSYSEQEVAAYIYWTPVQIKERGLKLLKFLERRWGISFANEEEMLDLLHLKFLSPDLQEEPQVKKEA
jgi:uncharacterized protein with ParB-like and HNH nuclease domain